MAFNPFNVFRRNQKILFAILTIIIMFMFVFSTGLGRGIDFFDWVPRWLGSKSARGDVMAVIDGDKIRDSEIERLRERRELANQYMATAYERASENLAKYLIDGLTRVTPENRSVVQEVLMARRMGYGSQQLQQQIQMAQFGLRPMPTIEDLLADRDRSIARFQMQLSQIAKGKNENDAHIAQAAQMLIDTDLRPLGKQTHYFGNQPNATKKDVLEFMLWQRKADKLGIAFQSGEVQELVKTEFFRKLDEKDWQQVEERVKGKHGFTPAALLEALGEEFRVRAAQMAVLGSGHFRATAKEYDAPSDYFAYYKEQCTTGRFGLISVPTENYLPRVTGEPTDAELRDLFNKSRTTEPDPRLARPGFKVPRRLKLEWMEAKGDEPYYKAASEDALKKYDAMSRVGGFLALPLGGVSFAPVLAAPAALKLNDPVLDAKYAEYKAQHVRAADQNWYSTPFLAAAKPLDTSTNRPAHVASLAGALAGTLGTGGSALTAPTLFLSASLGADQKARLETVPAALIAPVSPTTGGLTTLLATMAAQAKATEALPLSAVRVQLAEKAKEDLTRSILNADLEKFQKELAKLGEKPDKAEARAYVDAFAKDHGFKLGRSQDFHSQFTMHADPGLKPLVDRMADADRMSGGYINPASFGGRFFTEADMLGRPTGKAATGLYQPTPYPERMLGLSKESMYLVWRLADQDAEVPRTIADPGVREKVVAAWRRQKARELAKQAADELAKQCQSLGTGFLEIDQKLRDKQAAFAAQFADPAAKDRVKYFDVDRVAPLVSQTMPGAMPQAIVGPFGLTATANMPYPTAQMATDLVAAKGKPLSSSVVLTDQAEETYYVATLVRRDEKSADDFALSVYGQFAEFQDLGVKVSLRHQAEVRKQARDQAIAFLKAEFKYEQEHAKVNEKVDSSSDD